MLRSLLASETTETRDKNLLEQLLQRRQQVKNLLGRNGTATISVPLQQQQQLLCLQLAKLQKQQQLLEQQDGPGIAYVWQSLSN